MDKEYDIAFLIEELKKDRLGYDIMLARVVLGIDGKDRLLDVLAHAEK